MGELKKHFRVELINRIDEIIVFSPLTEESITSIAGKILEGLVESVQRKYRKKLCFDNSIVPALCKMGSSAEFGARNLQRVIQEVIEIPLTQLLVSAGKQEYSHIRCVLKSGKIAVQPE